MPYRVSGVRTLEYCPRGHASIGTDQGRTQLKIAREAMSAAKRTLVLQGRAMHAALSRLVISAQA